MAAMRGLIVIQEGASHICKLRAPKTAAEVLNAVRRNGDIYDKDGVRLVGSDSLEAGNYTFKQIDVPSTPAANLSIISESLKRMEERMEQMERMKRMEDVIGISLIRVKRELMFMTSKQSSRPGNGIFKEKLIEFYGVDTTGPVDLNEDWTRHIRCMVTNHLFTQKDVTAAHLIGYSMRYYAPMLLGMKDIDSPRNGLLLLKPLEDAFDDSRICFSYDKLMDSFILHILDAEYLDKKVGDSKRLSKPSKVTVGDTTFKDLEGRVILFPNNKRPFKRALQFHARQDIALSIERDTLLETFCMESWNFDYGSAGDYKDVVERWFTRNTEYIDGSKDISTSEDVRQDDCVGVKKTESVDEDLAVGTNSEGWSEDRTITTEANSESWSEEPCTVTSELT